MEGSRESVFYRMFPIMMKRMESRVCGLVTYCNFGLSTITGMIRPIVFTGPSILFDPVVLVSDSKYFGEILNNLDAFPKYKGLYSVLAVVVGDGLVTSVGETHKKQRKLIAPVFHSAALKSAMQTIEKCAKKFVEADLISSGLVITEGSFKRFTLSVVSDYAFSSSFDVEWMEKFMSSITRRLQLQIVLTQFLGDPRI